MANFVMPLRKGIKNSLIGLPSNLQASPEQGSGHWTGKFSSLAVNLASLHCEAL